MAENNYLNIDESYLDELIENRKLEKETKHRDGRIKFFIVLLILLLLFLLFLLFLFYLLYNPKKPAVVSNEPFEALFSIYNLQKPLGVSVDEESNIYVSNTGGRQVLVFNKDGNLLRSLGSKSGRGLVAGVYGSVYDKKTNQFFVSDFVMKQVQVFDPKNGEFLFRFPNIPTDPEYGKGGFTPFDVEIYKDKVYVLSSDGVYIFSMDGKLDRSIKQYNDGSKIVSFRFPDAFTISEKGDMFIADTLNKRIVAMKQDGSVRWIFGKPDDGYRIQGMIGLPKGIDMDSEGRLYISDTFHNEIIILEENGKLLSIMGNRGVKDAQFNFPEQLEIGPGDIIYVADRENNRVQALKVKNFVTPDPTETKEYSQNFRSFEE